MKHLLLYISMLIFVGTLSAHPLHLSITNMDITQDSIHFSIKIFEDDFTDVLTDRGLSDLSFAPCIETTMAAINSYINEYFRVNLNGKSITLSVHKTETKELAVWIYTSISISEPVESLIITNKLMLNWFNDQKNLVITNYKGKEQGFQFDNRQQELEIPIKK